MLIAQKMRTRQKEGGIKNRWDERKQMRAKVKLRKVQEE